MEIESSSTPVMTKKLWSMVKAAFYMFKKSIAKTKLLFDLHRKLKNGKLAGKAFTNLLLHHHSAASACRHGARMAFTAPQEHTASIDDTPAACTTFISKSHHCSGDAHTIQQAPEVVDHGGAAMEALLQAAAGHLTDADSPLPAEEEGQVDKAAEEFIKRFYKQLKQQRFASVESPSPDHLWG